MVYWPGGYRVSVTDAGEPARRAGVDSPTPDPASAGGLLAGSGLLGAGAAEPQSRRPSGRCPAHRRIRQRPGARSPHRLGRSVAPPSRRWYRQDPRAAAHAADLPRLRTRWRHQLRRIRQGQPPRYLATSRSRSDRNSARAVSDPRRCMDHRKQTRTGASTDEPPRRARLDLRGDQLPTQPAQHLAGSHHRRQARPGVGQGAHQRIRRRSGLHRHHRWFGRRPPVVTGRANAE
ncbi:Uncharacterised protein [Mycobacterium tuberculosis]|nr:Uncharacterised protein [Mycobacterium tuberculosis]